MKTILVILILYTGDGFINKPYEAENLGSCNASAYNLIKRIGIKYEDVNGYFTKQEHYQIVAYACYEEV